MSAAGHRFDLGIDGLAPVDDGSSVLLTGNDVDTLESLFYRLVSPTDGEHPLVVSTVHDARTIERNLEVGYDVDPTIVTCEGRSRDEAVTVVDDPANLTELGMELSARFQEQSATPVRAGIFHTTDLCREADDTRAVYRFLNSNLLTNLRRQSAIGVAAIHTDEDVQADVSSIVRGMETAFTGRIHVDRASRRDVDVTVEGLSTDGPFTVDI